MKRLKTSHLRNSILFTSLFTIVGILSIYLPISYSLSSSVMLDNAQSNTEKLLLQVRHSVEFYSNEMITISEYLSDSERVLQYMQGESPLSEHLSTSEAKALVASDLKAIASSRNDFANILLIRQDGDFVTNRDHVGLTPYWNYRSFDWYEKTLAAKGKAIMTSSRVENLIAGEYRWVVSLSRGIYVDGRFLGILLIDLNYRAISDICNSISGTKDGYVYILGADNRLVYHPQQQLIYSGIKSERFDLASHSDGITSVILDETIYSSTWLPTADWVIVSVFDTSQLITISSQQIAFYFGIGLFFALVALVISLKASKRLSDPILALKNSMQRFQQGDFDAKAEITVNNEIAELGDQFNVMTERIKNLVANGLLVEEQKRKSEIQALQSQIRPHFLYNTLESIIWMASSGQQENVVEMTAALAKLMRASASNANELVTLEQEIDYVTNYLKIQKLRYQDKLQDRIEVDPSVKGARILRLTLQPLVENAIYHGIKQMRGQGLILIKACRTGEDLLIQVADNGVGFPTAVADKKLEDMPNRDDSIGLSNVNDRIKLYFGAGAGLEIHSAPEGQVLDGFPPADKIRTAVAIRLPLVIE